mmetsp:Transcript_8143/g.26214  ORF Transcript_8143/g.26214 Transcript_8143/m.26214 type:complete len:212 (-) Transcript_8143:96-731(-)
MRRPASRWRHRRGHVTGWTRLAYSGTWSTPSPRPSLPSAPRHCWPCSTHSSPRSSQTTAWTPPPPPRRSSPLSAPPPEPRSAARPARPRPPAEPAHPWSSSAPRPPGRECWRRRCCARRRCSPAGRACPCSTWTDPIDRRPNYWTGSTRRRAVRCPNCCSRWSLPARRCRPVTRCPLGTRRGTRASAGYWATRPCDAPTCARRCRCRCYST